MCLKNCFGTCTHYSSVKKPLLKSSYSHHSLHCITQFEYIVIIQTYSTMSTPLGHEIMLNTFLNKVKMHFPNLIPKAIFDCGSRDCRQSLELNTFYPDAEIYAFECNSQTLPQCRVVSNENKKIHLVEKAINSYNGKTKFHQIDPQKTQTSWPDSNPGASSLFVANGEYPHEKYVQNSVEVECTRLDSFCEQNNIQQVDIIHADCQGAELIAFMSLGNLLKDVYAINTEVTFKPMYHDQILFEDLNKFLIANGFFLANEDTMDKSGWQADAIYLNFNKLMQQKKV